MVSASTPCQPEPDAASWTDVDLALVEQAGALRRAYADGSPVPLLRGRNLGLLCPDATTPAARLFREAAGALGAQVAHIKADAYAIGGDVELESTARVLGRLYDTVECQGLAPGVAQQLAALTGNVVCDGLAVDGGVMDRLARRLGGSLERSDNRRFALQALLLRRLT
jgi:ornithine carbamoyltransferase